MLGLLLLIVIYIILGFMYAWIAGIVAREEITVGKGVFIVLLPGIVNIAIAIAGIDVGLFAIVIDLIMLTLGGKFIAQLDEWKHAAIIACVYTVLLFLVGLGLTRMFS